MGRTPDIMILYIFSKGGAHFTSSSSNIYLLSKGVPEPASTLCWSSFAFLQEIWTNFHHPHLYLSVEELILLIIP